MSKIFLSSKLVGEVFKRLMVFSMNTRIVKRYQEAIRALNSKQPYNFDELPCPPGYPPLPQPKKTSITTGNAQSSKDACFFPYLFPAMMSIRIQ